MKSNRKRSLLLGLLVGTSCNLIADTTTSPDIPYLFKGIGDCDSCPELIWALRPGNHYRVDTSQDLKEWTTGKVFQASDITHVPPTPEGNPKGFYRRITEIDLTPPVISSAYPAPDSYSIPRNNRLRVVLEDDSGIDPDSIRVTLGRNEGLTIASEFVNFSDQVLTVNAGSDPKDPESKFLCEDFGKNVQVRIEVADIRGNATNFSWSFENEIETTLSAGLFVFGSARAIEMGQKVSAEDLELKRLLGQEIPKEGEGEWAISRISEDTLTLIVPTQETGSSLLNQFKVGAPLMNTSTTDLRQVFFRRVLSKSGPTLQENGSWLIDLETEDIVYEECFESFALSLDDRAMGFEVKENKLILPKPSNNRSIGINVNRSWTLASISRDWSDLELFENNPNVSLSFDELGFSASVTGSASVKYVRDDPDKRIDLSLVADAEAACIPVLNVSFEGSLFNLERTIVPQTTLTTFLVPVGPIVIPVSLQFETKLEAQAGGSFQGEVRGGFTYDKRISYNFGWRKDSGTYGGKNISGNGLQQVELTAGARGNFDASLKVIPKLSLKVGASLDIKVLKVNASATVSAALIAYADLKVTGSGGVRDLKIESCLTAGLDYDVDGSYIIAFDPSWPFNNLDFELSGTADILDGEFFPPFEWCWTYQRDWSIDDILFEEAGAIISLADNDLTVPAPGPVIGEVDGALDPRKIRYQWIKDGVPIPCQNRPTLRLSKAGEAHSGEYQLEISHGQKRKITKPIPVRVVSEIPQPPEK